ncbi:MAG: flagellar biosynthetic protein FliR [Bryobacteraceae bacterium]
MPADFALGLPTLYGFMLVLARVSGVFALVPLPGFQSAPKLARIVLSVLITLTLFPLWPQIDAARVDAPRVLLWVLPEIAVGVTIGLGVAFILEVFLTGAQILSLNAGFSFAQTIDPTTQAQSGVLVVFAQLAGGMVFLSLGLDREVIRTLAYSLEVHPAGAWITQPAAEAMLRLGGDMLARAVRLALPAIAFLVLADIALGLMGRLNAQLQLMTLAFPIKMTAALVLLGWITVLLPRLLAAYGGLVFGTVRQALRF